MGGRAELHGEEGAQQHASAGAGAQTQYCRSMRPKSSTVAHLHLTVMVACSKDEVRRQQDMQVLNRQPLAAGQPQSTLQTKTVGRNCPAEPRCDTCLPWSHLIPGCPAP